MNKEYKYKGKYRAFVLKLLEIKHKDRNLGSLSNLFPIIYVSLERSVYYWTGYKEIDTYETVDFKTIVKLINEK